MFPPQVHVGRSPKINLSQLILITSINVYLVNFFTNLGSIFIFWPDFTNFQQRINTFFNLNQKIDSNNKITTLPPITKINITNCYFKLDNKTLFTNINLTLQNTNMIVGTSGIGKTSLLMLIAHKYIPTSGSININDTIDLQAINRHTWLKRCIYLSSNPYIYHGSVLENILSFFATNEKLSLWQQLGIDNILQAIGLTSFSMCHDYGSNLSQGQKQIIVFCSLFFSNCQVLLLDEILSNVNNEIKVALITLLVATLPHTIIIYAGHDLTLKPLFTNIIKAFLPLCTIFKFYHINAEKSLSTDFSPHF
ncbi:ATP-binding cassette domain-containing protein [Spiroplasma endosymbiont of Virgichneumon dumeticola]|uniref:ATP-binding cassette domain-containing protein n=1 Tax=Spiroplasma endosymbiont of Virgichneumon dumeticola TaxID=3139323 RepID=UPI0035C9355B